MNAQPETDSVPVGKLKDQFTGLVHANVPEWQYYAKHRYRVVKRLVDGRYTLQAVNTRSGVPDLDYAEPVTGVPGVTSHLELGSIVLVEFIEGDPGQPHITHFASEGSPYWIPKMISVRADASIEIKADTVKLGSGKDPVATVGSAVVVFGTTGAPPIAFAGMGSVVSGKPGVLA